MLSKTLSVNKRTICVLSIFFFIFFSFTVAAQSIGDRLDNFDNVLSNRSNTYETLVVMLNDVKDIQLQLEKCIQSAEVRIKKIDYMLHEIELAKSFKPGSQPFHYLTKEKDENLAQIGQCHFFNYRLNEIRDLAIDQLNQVNKFPLYTRTPIWEKSSYNIFSNLSIESVFSQYNIELLIKCMIAYLLFLLLIRRFLALGLRGTPWPNALTIFHITILMIVITYVWTMQFFFYQNTPVPLQYLDYHFVVYIAVILRLAIGFMDTSKQWLTPKMCILLQRRVDILATGLLLAFTGVILLDSTQLSALSEALFITILNMSYLWLIQYFFTTDFLDGKAFQLYRKNLQIILQIFCLAGILLAWLGYFDLAISLIPNLIITVVLIKIILGVNNFLSRLYILLSNSTQGPSQKLRYILGIKTDNKLVELFVIRIVITLPIIVMGVLALLELWGLTHYQILNLFISLHGGVPILDKAIRPTMLIRAATIFCIIVLMGRALSAYIVRHTLITEEKNTKSMVVTLIQYFSFIAGLLISLYVAGVELKGLIIITGGLSVGLGFGLQNFAKDFVSGLIIMINKPVKIGDHVIIGDKNLFTEGYIKKIGSLSTQLHTLIYTDVIVPNSDIVTKSIANLTFNNNKFIRINITVPISKKSDLELGRQILLDIAAKNPGVSQVVPNHPIVLFDLNALTLWCVIEDVNQKDKIISELNFAIENAFKEMV